jgi:autotransporter-associated beta strand protein
VLFFRLFLFDLLQVWLPCLFRARLRRHVTVLLAGAAAGLLSISAAQAQGYTWGGAGSTTHSVDYNLATNWSNAPAGAPPVSLGTGAYFDSTGSSSVNITGGSIAPDFFNFTVPSQSYTFTGADIKFSSAVPVFGGIFDNADLGQTISIANNIGESVAGVQVILQGSSTLVLSGTNTYSGGTHVGVGTLQVTNNNSVGTGTVTLGDGLFQAGGSGDLTFTNNFKIDNSISGSAIDANGVQLTIAGNITDGSGAGKLTILDSSFGSGVVTLLGTNTYSGGTTICSCATLVLGDATHTASIIGKVGNEGQFAIQNADMSGVTTLTNDGFTSFLGTTSASTMTIINHALLSFMDASSAGNATIKNTSGSVIYFGTPGGNDTSTAGSASIDNRDSGTIFAAYTNAGNATITNRDGGGTVFIEQSSAANAVITNSLGGFTIFGTPYGSDAPTAGNAVITNNDGSSTQFNAFSTAGSAIITTNSGAATFFYDNSTGGTAQFITNGTGFVDFSGSLGPNGDGRIAAGSIAGSGIYYIGAGNTLVVGGNDLSTTMSGVIADFNPCGCGLPGPGNLEKAGSGTLILSGVNTYTGTTAVNGGILQVDGSIASSSLTTVNTGGALTGIGTVGNTVIASGGIFLPGNGTPGTSTTVSGNLAFQSGALYLVGINSMTSTFTSVTGNATLDGSVGVGVVAGSTVMKQYTILSASGGRSGTFSGLDSLGLPSGLVASLSYDPTHAYLNFVLDYGAKSNLNINQTNVATTLQNFFNANGGINAVFAGLSPNGLTQASGEPATGSQQTTFNAMGLFLGLLTDPFVAGRDGGFGGSAGATPFADESTSLAYAARKNDARDAFASIYRKAPPRLDFEQRWSVWAAGYGGSQTTSGNTALGSNNTTSSVYGSAVGADYRFSPNTIAGFALAGGGTNFSVNGLGYGRSDLFQAGASVRHTVGPAYISAALAYGWQDITTDRIVTVAGVDHLRAEFNANAWSGRLEGGYRYATPWIGVTPYAAAQFTSFELPSYAETVVSGGGAFALNYAAKSVTDTRSELGLRTDKSFALDSSLVTLRGRLAWAHDYNPDRTIGAVFQTLPGAAFVVNGAAQSRDSALTTASAEIKWRNGWSAAATFEGEFSNVTQSYAGKGVMRYAW